jgi:hypothetical protein
MYTNSYSQAQIFDPVDYTQNATFQANFLSAIGETTDFCIDFEAANLRNSPVGPSYKNLHNVAGLFPNGVIFTETDGNLWVAQGKGMTWEDVDSNNDNDLGEGPAYAGLWSLSNYEQESTTIDFSVSPVDYVSFYIGDWDLQGKPESYTDCKITLIFADNSTLLINTDRIPSKYEFWGYYVGPGGKKIKKVTLKCYNNNSQWGLDNVCFGTISPTCNLAVTATNTGPYCTGVTLSLSSTVSGASGAVSYSWVGPSGFTSTSANPSRTNLTTAMAGTYTVTVTNNGCTAIATTAVIVNTAPTSTVANGGPYCVGQTISLTSSGGTSYLWSGPSSFTSTSQNPTRSNATLAMGGTYTVTISNSNCSVVKTTSVVVNQTIATASSNSPVCVNTPLNLAATGGGTYSWSGPDGFTSTSQNPVISSYQTTNTGTYTVTVTKNGCTSTATTNVSTNTSCTSPCSISGSGFQNLACFDNNTNSNESDDRITFSLLPYGTGLSSTYNLTVSSGSVSPTSGSYASLTNYTMNVGSAGGGNVTVTITDTGTSGCTLSFVITDPGSCSTCPVSTCDTPNIIKN